MPQPPGRLKDNLGPVAHRCGAGTPSPAEPRPARHGGVPDASERIWFHLPRKGVSKPQAASSWRCNALPGQRHLDHPNPPLALMEAARPLDPREDPERELQRLRPFGEAYLMRNFGEQLAYADAEDAVSDVTLRLHRQIAAGNPPENLQGAFLTGARNAAIDRLRRSSRKPTVAIEAAAETPADLPAPEELAERSELAARVREVLARVSPRQRQALTLRFGRGLTVPQIAEQMQISLPAAKNLLARGIEQARRRYEAIEGNGFCPEAQRRLRESLPERELAALAGPEERAELRSHLEHCGECRSYLASLHRGLHEIGAAGVLATSAVQSDSAGHLGGLLTQAGEALQAGLERLRLGAYKAGGALGADGGAAGGALAGTGQKVIAVCGAAGAGAATCLATGIVGPGVGVLPHHHGDPVPRSDPAPAAQVRHLSETVPPPTPAPDPEPEPTPPAAPPQNTPEPQFETTTEPEPAPSPAEQSASEFGLESPAPPPEPAPEPEPPPPPPPRPAPAAPPPPSGGGGGDGARASASPVSPSPSPSRFLTAPSVGPPPRYYLGGDGGRGGPTPAYGRRPQRPPKSSSTAARNDRGSIAGKR